MKNKHEYTRHLLSVLILLVTVGGIVWYLSSKSNLLHSLTKVSFFHLGSLVVLRMLFLTMNGLFLEAFASKFQVHLKAIEWFGLSVVTTMGNYLTPLSGGLIARAAYLKSRHRFPYAQFVTIVTSNYLLTFWITGVVGMASLTTFIGMEQFSWLVLLLFMSVAGAISTSFILPSVRLPWDNRLARTINASLEGWMLVKQDIDLILKLGTYTILNILFSSLSFWVAFRALGSQVSFVTALLVGLLASFSILVNLTPGNLGIHEAVISLSAGLLGAGTSQGLLAALLIRSATILTVFTLGPIFSFLLARETSQSVCSDEPISVS